MNESSFQNSEHSFFGDEQDNIDSEKNKNQVDNSKNSSNPENIFDKVNKEIRRVIENGKDLSYSNSNSRISDQYQNKEQFLYSRFWCVKKNNNENDSSKLMINNKLYNKLHKNNFEEKYEQNENNKEENIIYYNKDFEETKSNDDFDEDDRQEQTIENREKGINEINSIKVNNNNLNNKDSLTSIGLNTSINLETDKITEKIGNSNEIESENLFNEKINPSNTPNKINQAFTPHLYNTNQVHSFISTYNNYQSNISKGSFISTNNSSNNKCKKNEERCSSEIEEEFRLNNFNNQNINNDELKANNNNIYTHGNKFGPHLMDYSHLKNNSLGNINMDQNNITNMNNINNFNINNNYMYRSIPKMNLNMVYYLPIQQQAISTNSNYITGNKILSNISNANNDNNSNNVNLKSKNKDNKTNINTNNLNNSNTNSINNDIKEKDKSDSKEKKTKNNSNNNNSINNNYKNNNNNYKTNDNHNSNTISNTNNNNNNQYNKCEKNLLNLDDIVSGKDTRTTVMIRNIPIKYTDTILVDALSEFKGKYDCLYMPYDYEKKGNKGYAFINFVNPLHILYFHEKFCGKKWPLFESPKICELNSANFQGINEIQKHSKNYKGLRKPLFYAEQNNNNNINENIIIPSKYLQKLKLRFPKMKYHENKVKKLITIDSFE